MAGSLDLKEFVAGFLVEAEEYLDTVNRNLVAASEALRLKKPEPRAVRELFRALHTIKGLASMVGAEPIVAISHEMEGILRSADRAGGALNEMTLDLLLKGTRAIEERVEAITKVGINAIPPAPKALVEALAMNQNSDAPKPSSVAIKMPAEIEKSLTASEREQINQALRSQKSVVVLEFQPSPAHAADGFNITTVREKLGVLGDLIKVIPRSSPGAPTGIVFSLIVATTAETASLAKAARSEESSVLTIEPTAEAPTSDLGLAGVDFEISNDWTPTDHSSIRVDVRKLDDALERLSDLVVTRSKLARVASEMSARGVDVRDLNLVLTENTRQLKRLRASITQARMVPLTELLQRLPLVVRGLTKNTDKAVELILQVGTTEVDKAVSDKIFPAIVHLIRNAVDHAVETRTERRALGKPETATIKVVCDDTSGTMLMLTLSDDGRGIDREAVAKRAGIAIARDDQELLQQISMPGLSTQEGVTTTSGRGMGMDIVRRTVELLGGQLTLSTTPGKGTTFGLEVPVSITIVDVLSFKVSDQIYVVPVSMVDEIVEVDPKLVTKSPSPKQTGREPLLIQRRGQAIPFLPLDVLLSGKPTEIPSKALIVNQRRGGAFAFGVDKMLGQQEVVLRPLDDALIRVSGVAGATDLGDGRPTLVLDLATFGAASMTSVGAQV